MEESTHARTDSRQIKHEKGHDSATRQTQFFHGRSFLPPIATPDVSTSI